jgi:glycogen operon protein
VFHRRTFLSGGDPMGSGLPDIWWFRSDGRKLTRRDWADPGLRSIGVYLNGREIPSPSPRGERVTDDDFLLLVNSGGEPVSFRLPVRRFGLRWQLELSTEEPDAAPGSRAFAAREEVVLVPRSFLVLRRA